MFKILKCMYIIYINDYLKLNKMYKNKINQFVIFLLIKILTIHVDNQCEANNF